MAMRVLTAARVRTMVERQVPTRWGPKYVPAILATKGEAPSISAAAILPSEKLQRDIHALSRPEKALVALALVHPRLFEFKEQHILSLAPSAHPLVGHPKASGLALPVTSGTVNIAERLGVLPMHPQVLEKTKSPEGTSERWIPAPWIGDLLLFLLDDQGPYCVSWDVKRNEGDHGRPGPGDWTTRTKPRRVRQAAARDQVYVEYMRELGIRIVRVAKSQMDPMLVINLNRLMVLHPQPINLPQELHAELIHSYGETLNSGHPPTDVINRFAKQGVDRLEAKRVLEQAIWARQIRIDLFSPWSIDSPLRPEERDPLVVHADWFAR